MIEELLSKVGCAIVLEGEESSKIIDGKEQKVVPFIAINKVLAPGKISFGIIYSGKKVLGACHFENNLIGYWRAMKIFSLLKSADGEILQNCLTAGMREIPNNDPEIVRLSEYFESRTAFQLARSNILNSSPEREELAKMLEKIEKEKIELNSEELKEEIKFGQIEFSLVGKVIESVEGNKEKRRKAIEEITKPVPPEKSIRVFLAELNFTDFCLLFFPGMMASVRVEEMDRIVKQESLLRGCYIFKKLNRKLGLIEGAFFKANDGIVFNFLSARYSQESFYVMTKIEKDGHYPVKGEYSISALRELVRDQRSIKFVKKSLWQNLKDYF